MALIAIASLFVRRSSHEHPSIMLSEVLLAVVSIFACSYALKKFSISTPRLLVASCVGCLIAMPWLVDRCVRMFGMGIAFELAILSSLAWGSLAAGVLGRHIKLNGISVICSGFLTLFTTFIADAAIAVFLAYVWGTICLWWLVANHWERVQTSAAVDIRKTTHFRILTIVLGIAVFALASWAVTGRMPMVQKLTAQLMPTSGGTSGNDKFATSGVGDGEVLIAARENPQSFGAVDTDLFLESHEPSLFDVISEQFGEPRKKDRWESAQSLDSTSLKEQESRVAEANRASSQTFSIDRQPPKLSKTLNDLKSNALMFWIGRSGVSLAVDRFENFDGQRWTKQGDDETIEPHSILIGERAWFQHPRFTANKSSAPYVGAIREALKFTRFRSPTIPTHFSLQLWHIDKIDRADFFGLRSDDCLQMTDRDFVPDYTLLQFVNSELDLEKIEGLAAKAPIANDAKHHIQALIPLCNRYAQNYSRGWKQISAVINGLRKNFEFSRSGNGRLGGDNPLQLFLTSARGSDYMFATSAALMLRHLGYSTRFVTGFYADPAHADSLTGELPIVSNDVHAWLEVEIADDIWIPLEPTPGYLQPKYSTSFSYRVRQSLPTIAAVIVSAIALLASAWAFRSPIFESFSLLLWLVVQPLSDRQRIGWLLFVLDRRSWLANQQRPRQSTARQWYGEKLQHVTSASSSATQQFFDDADKVYFGGATQLSAANAKSLKTIWYQLTSQIMRKSRSK